MNINTALTSVNDIFTMTFPTNICVFFSLRVTYRRAVIAQSVHWLGYGLDHRGSRVRFPAGAGNFSFHHRVQTGSGAHPAFYPIGTGGSFPGGVKLTTYLHLVPRSRMRGAIPPLPQYVFMAWCLVKRRDNSALCVMYQIRSSPLNLITLTVHIKDETSRSALLHSFQYSHLFHVS
jgi:hypothetical protein